MSGGKIILKIAPDYECKFCYGSGVVEDRVDYGSTVATLHQACECVEAQVPQEAENYQIEIIP